MSQRIIYKIDFYSYWHTGSGLAGSTYADAIVNKNEQNLPVIPGKTIKGLLRDAAQQIHYFDDKLVTQDFIQNVFGADSEKQGVDYKKEGKAFFSNAELSKSLSNSIIEKKYDNELYKVLPSTQIDENGQAKDGSLRQLEVTIPLTLYGAIEHFPESETYLEQLENCFAFIKQIGLNRNRGLGKCKFSILKINKKHEALSI